MIKQLSCLKFHITILETIVRSFLPPTLYIFLVPLLWVYFVVMQEWNKHAIADRNLKNVLVNLLCFRYFS